MRRFTGDNRRAVAFPLGGLGAGHVALCGDGSLRQWQLTGLPNHTGHIPDSFFALRLSSIEPPGDVCRLLRSAPVPAHPHPAPNVTDADVPEADRLPGWAPVTDTTFEAAYPYARVSYLDDELPVEVRLEAYTPFVPLDADASGLPLVRYRFTLTNRTDELRHGWLLASLQNAVGWDGVTPVEGNRCASYGGNVNRVVRRPGQAAVLMDNPTLPEDDLGYGEMLLWTSAPAAVLPRATGAADALRFAETAKLLTPTQLVDFSETALRAAVANAVSPMRSPTGPSPTGATWNGVLAIALALEPGETSTVDVVHAWWFPNRHADFDRFGPQHPYGPSRQWIGNHYGTRFGGALDVLDGYLAREEELAASSTAWAEAIGGGDLPAPIAEALSIQGTLVRSPSLFRAADGRMYGFEGALGASTRNWNGDAGGSCPLNCNHVFNYEQALSRLFPILGQGMRDTEWEIQAPEGYLPHRVVLPAYLPQLHGVPIGGPERPALDGMLGAVLKTYRSVRDGADEEWLRGHWPSMRRLMEYVASTWDTDGDGVLVGDQPVTYDISLHGANMFVGGLWLAALRSMQRMAAIVDGSLVDFYGDLFTTASAAYDQLLWNGEYYGQPPTGEAYDFGPGCLSDQLLGQWWAHQLDLGYLLPADRVRTALASIVRYNLRTGFTGHGYRGFADRDDTGLVICTWPRGGRPTVPLRYCDEVWTGIEYQVAAHCLTEGLIEEGLRIVQATQARYDGSRRNPYNEIECGDHYVRAMAGWSLLDAYTGLRYDATTRRIRVGDRPGTFPFVAGTAWGTVTVADGAASLRILGGTLDVDTVEVG